ncbi:MAG: hypothetical protein DRJ05_02960, partial [Bacteroidetes bacterium]
MQKNKFLIVSISIVLFSIIFGFQLNGQDKLVEILEEELGREMKALENEETPPYFISYSVNDVHEFGANALFGNLLNSDTDRTRSLRVAIRVGSHKLDNTRKLDEFGGGNGFPGGGGYLPIENEPLAIKQALWNETNMTYINAVDTYSNLVIKLESKDKEETGVNDFSDEGPAIHIDPMPDGFGAGFDEEILNGKVKKYSEVFLKEKDIVFGMAGISTGIERKYFISTEGTKIVENRYYANLVISGLIRSKEGLELPLHKTWFVFDVDDLPDDETVMREVDQMIVKLIALRDAPFVEPYE